MALAEAGNFTRAAGQIFIAQPTLSQQIQRLEEIVGTPLLQRRREGLRLTPAGRVLLDASRTVLAQIDQTVSQTQQTAGLGRPRLRVVMPPGLPQSLVVRATAGAYGMVRISLQHHPLTASAALVWSSDLPRPLQQMLFGTADRLTEPTHPQPADLISLTAAQAARQPAQAS